jgi:predicted RNA-binding Zn ribbon-like protein
MMPSPSAPFELTGGHPALDFVNTVGGKRLAAPRDHIHGFADLLSWATQAHVLSPPEAKALLREAQAHPEEASRALERARVFRESLYRLLLSLLEGRPPPKEDVSVLDAEVRSAQAGRRLRVEGGVCAFSAPDVSLADTVIPRLALAAAELLTVQGLKRVRVCEATRTDGCGWLFVDETRNHSRRWCDMATCGNQHKARRHYARVRAKA